MDSKNVDFMMYGLIAAWAVVMVYITILVLRESKLRRELDRVKQMVEPEKR
jgi:hypothetical protein